MALCIVYVMGMSAEERDAYGHVELMELTSLKKDNLIFDATP